MKTMSETLEEAVGDAREWLANVAPQRARAAAEGADRQAAKEMPSGPAEPLPVLRISFRKASKEGRLSSTEVGVFEWARAERALDKQKGLAAKVPDQHL